MSSQSMKYHDLPSLKLLQAYKQGELTGEDLSWVEERIANNPMVAGVVDQMDISDYDVVRSIRDRVRQKVVEPHFTQVGFWTKYGVWIGLSSIVILLGIVGISTMDNPEPRYFNENMLLSDHKINTEASVELETRENNSPEQRTQEEMSSANQTANQAPDFDDQQAMTAIDQRDNKKDDQQKEDQAVQKSEEQNDDSEQAQKTVDNTRTFDNAETKNQTILLAVSTVQILSKANPDALNTRTSGGGGNPLGDQTTSSGNSFSVNDIPAYPGGDRALGDYFKGKLRPIEIPKHQDKFDRTVLIELTINARGKLKDYKIRGQLHPTHQEALKKAIEELPRFRKGSEKITYSLGVSF